MTVTISMAPTRHAPTTQLGGTSSPHRPTGSPGHWTVRVVFTASVLRTVKSFTSLNLMTSRPSSLFLLILLSCSFPTAQAPTCLGPPPQTIKSWVPHLHGYRNLRSELRMPKVLLDTSSLSLQTFVFLLFSLRKKFVN